MRADRVKRQLLRGMVDENVETISGQPLGSSRRLREQRRARIKKAIITATFVAVAVISITAWFSDGQDDALAASSANLPTQPRAVATGAPAERMAPAQQLAQNLSAGQPNALVGEIIPLTIERVAIDAGHGGRDGGTSLSFGLLEKDLTRDIADRLTRRLDEASLEWVLTRAGDETVSLKERAARANAAGADLFMSIHVNWLPNRNARGVETYYLGTTDDPFLRRLAASENRDSGYSMADYRRLLEGIYADVRQAESQRLAGAVQESLFSTLREENAQIVSRGVLSAPFVVLVATEMPAILAEVACLSNAHEARLLAIPSYRQSIADALFSGINSYMRSVGRTGNALAEKGNNNEQGQW